MVNDCLEKEKKFKKFSQFAKKSKEQNWSLYSDFKIKKYNGILEKLQKITTTLTPLPVLIKQEETRNLIIEDKNLEPLDFILSLKIQQGAPKGKFIVNFSFELDRKIVVEKFDLNPEETPEYTFKKKYTRGKDLKDIDNTLH